MNAPDSTVARRFAPRRDSIIGSCDEIAANFQALKALAPEIERAAATLVEAVAAGGKVMFCGNGGSAADSQHLAAELTGRYLRDRPPVAAVALSTDTSALTAIGNDYGYQHVFERQVRALGRAGDVLVGISTSGNSPNVLLAAEAAKALGIVVVAMTGAGGGKLAAMADVALKVPSGVTNRIQEMHIAIGHLLCGFVEDSLPA
jgi:D-sedoheptulose 7-phosphate isomerase